MVLVLQCAVNALSSRNFFNPLYALALLSSLLATSPAVPHIFSLSYIHSSLLHFSSALLFSSLHNTSLHSSPLPLLLHHYRITPSQGRAEEAMAEMEAIMVLPEIKHGAGNGTEQVALAEVDPFRGGKPG